MKRSRFTEEQVVAILREQEAGVATADLCRNPDQLRRSHVAPPALLRQSLICSQQTGPFLARVFRV